MIRVPRFSGARQALRQRAFRLYTVGNATSLVGTWMQRITVGFLAWELTHSATWLGIVALADLFPTVFIGPFAGVVADRWRRQTVLIVTQILGLCQALTLCLLYVAGWLTIGWLCGITLILGVITAFAQPARLALISSLVPRDLLGPAVGVNAISFNLARFVGPALAGMLISTAGIGWTFAANAATNAVFVWALARMPRLPAASGLRSGSFVRDLVSGLSYAARHRGTAVVLATMIVTGVAARPLMELLPGFSDRVFGRGPDGLAMLTSSIGIGAMLGAAWLVNLPADAPMARIMTTSALVGALSVALFTATDSLMVALPLITIAGCCWSLTGIAAQTLLQLGVPDEVRGRVLALYGLILKSSPALGALISGALADRFGLRPVTAAGALVAGAYVVWLWPRVERLTSDFQSSR